MKDISARCEV